MDNQWENVKQLEMPEEAFKQTKEFEEPSFGDSLYKVTKKSPFLIAGIIGFTAICGIGAYRWRTSKIPPALFIVQLRVAAQGTAIACLTLGMMQHMYTDYVTNKDNKHKKN